MSLAKGRSLKRWKFAHGVFEKCVKTPIPGDET